MDLTKKVINVLKNVDKLVEDIKRDGGRIIASAVALKDSFGKSEGEQEK